MPNDQPAGGPELMPPDLITLKAAAALCHVHVATVHRWCDHGELPFWWKGHRRFVSREDLTNMVRKGEPKVKAKPRGKWEQREIDRWTRETLAKFGLTAGPAPDANGEK